MNEWLVSVLDEQGRWLHWSGNGWTFFNQPVYLTKEESVVKMKRVISDVSWVYGVKMEPKA